MAARPARDAPPAIPAPPRRLAFAPPPPSKGPFRRAAGAASAPAAARHEVRSSPPPPLPTGCAAMHSARDGPGACTATPPPAPAAIERGGRRGEGSDLVRGNGRICTRIQLNTNAAPGARASRSRVRNRARRGSRRNARVRRRHVLFLLQRMQAHIQAQAKKVEGQGGLTPGGGGGPAREGE